MKKSYFLYGTLTLIACFAITLAYAETKGVKKRRLRPHEYGNVLIDNYSSLSNTVSPVVFKHWLHRSKYTCRLCHVDIGFAMYRGQTDITCEDNKNGIYCGSCHDGKESFARIEKQRGKEIENCDLCHSNKKDVTFKNDFYKFRTKFKRERFGNGIDWLNAEEERKIRLTDYLKGISIKRKKLINPKELEYTPKEDFMPDIIFSHKKHAVWSGCELCHPDLFGVKAGETVYSMRDIFDGKYCGVCHGLVAFPNQDCQRCHTKEVH